jgi:hypothetical protein
MRAMRHQIALFTFVVFVGCGSEGVKFPDMSMPLDLAPGPDLAVRTPDGVVCGSATCPVGQSCCVTANGTMVTGSTCVPSANQCTGALLACDGPEDCTASTPTCCGTIMFSGGGGPDGGTPMFQGGNAMCTASCAFNLGTGSVTTRLCQADVDCAGLMVPILNQPTQCCSSTLAPGLHFCATSVPGSVTCP